MNSLRQSYGRVDRPLGIAITLLLLLAPLSVVEAGTDLPLELKQGDKIVVLGNTLAERMQYFGRFETLLHSRFPELKLTVRNLGWSGDQLTMRLRSKDFDDHGHTLLDHKPDVVLAMFGFNESFAGEAGLPGFRQDLTNFIADIRKLNYHSTTYERGSQDGTQQEREGEPAKQPTLVLVSPIAHENLHSRTLPDGEQSNENLALYTAAIREVAAENNVPFVDLFTPTLKGYSQSKATWTINGVHLSDSGYQRLAPILDTALFGPRPAELGKGIDLSKLHAAVNEKNLQFFYDYRAINGFYIYGGRKEPFGVVNFPPEFDKLRKMIVNRDHRIWDIAQGKSVPEKIDDSTTGDFVDIATNIKTEVVITSPDDAIQAFTLPEGFQINLFASEVEFPDLENPVQFTFDAQGRLWVVTMPSYPMYLPGTPVNDKVLILEDTDGDGKADKQTVFADGLHVPTGIELGDGGAYVAQQPNLMFLKDTDGDGKADVREYVLHGFDSADSHHSISAFEWGPGGGLYFQEGTFHHTQVETPYGPVYCANAAVYRYEPLTAKCAVHVSFDFANPWGHVFDRYGQNLVADASNGANYVGAAFSGDLDFPRKHGRLKQFLVKQWRPTSGCEIVASRNFPDEMQGDYLLNNVIGFHGVLQYRFKDDGSGFAADPVEPLVRSSDSNFRPVDLQFGPDGALYLCDWFNPLIGHMQHSLRDPNRDKNHGRIWRVSYTKKPLVERKNVAGLPADKLLPLLTEYEDRVRYRVRRELRERDTDQVMSAVDDWIAQLDTENSADQLSLLEALWIHQQHDVVDQNLLMTLLRSPDPRVRAAATRVLSYWLDRVDHPLELLRTQVNDDHPRVRLEAVRALSFFDSPEALEIAVESLIHPQDDYLEYTLNETITTLENRIESADK